MVWENVPGALSSGKPKGADFQIVLTEIVKIVKADAADVPLPKDGRWPKAGLLYGVGDDGQPFSVAWRIHDAQFWGVPQRRKRLALVADFNGLTAGEILFDPQYRGEAESAESDSSERDTGAECRPEVQPQCESLSRDLDESGAERETVTADSEDGSGESDGNFRDGIFYL
jgi:site-specific DNA-cytosine methylase